MKKIALVTMSLCLASWVWGVDLKNEDSVEYQLKIKDGPTETQSSISGNTTKVSICSDCTIEVVGIGEISASGDQVIVIRNGSIAIDE